MPLPPPIQSVLSTHLLSNSPSPPRHSLHWLWFSASLPLSSDETVFEGCRMQRHWVAWTDMFLPSWKCETVYFRREKRMLSFPSTLFARLASGTPDCSSHMIFMPTLARCQLCCLVLVSLPIWASVFSLENGDNDNTNLAGWLRGKWDESGARGFGFKV